VVDRKSLEIHLHSRRKRTPTEELKNSFELKRVADGSIYREAKYEKNIKIERIDEHIIYAADAYSKEPYKLLWTKNSGYTCAALKTGRQD
jgi:hypothetical protein